MLSVFHALIGLVGLGCSTLLTLGLMSDRAVQSAGAHLTRLRSITAPALDGAAADAAGPGDAIADEEWQDDLPAVAPDGQGAPATTLYRVCRVTAYCNRGITASGVQSGVGQCAAPADIPFGSTVYIPALGRAFIVTDRTHRRFRRSTVDIFIPSRGQCLRFGRRYMECEIVLPDASTNGLTGASARAVATDGRSGSVRGDGPPL